MNYLNNQDWTFPVPIRYGPGRLKELQEICQKNKIPVRVFSAKFFKNQWYFKFYGKWAKKILKSLTHIFTIDKDSEFFLKSKGFQNVSYCGDTRYDQVNTNLIKSSLKIKSPCLVLGSY